MPIKVVSDRLSHANAKMGLDVYANVVPGQAAEAVERLEEYLSTAK